MADQADKKKQQRSLKELFLTFKAIVSSIFNIPGGMLVDMVQSKGLLMAISLLWVGVPYFLMGFTDSYVMLLLCVALVGMGNNLWHPTAISTLSKGYPERRGFALSVHGMGANVGDALAPLAIGSYWDSWGGSRLWFGT